MNRKWIIRLLHLQTSIYPASINRVQNKGGIYLSRKELEDMKCLNPATDDIDRKIRAFWFPPYDGAFIELNGKRYTLINRQILSSLADPNSSSLFSCPAPSTDEGKNDWEPVEKAAAMCLASQKPCKAGGQLTDSASLKLCNSCKSEI